MVISGGIKDCDENKWDGRPGTNEGNDGVSEQVIVMSSQVEWPGKFRLPSRCFPCILHFLIMRNNDPV